MGEIVSGPERTTKSQDNIAVVWGLLVTGCPRSGTKYIAKLLTKLGRDIGHEKMGRHGISSWCMAVQAPKAPWGPAREGHHKFEVIFHQVRNPVFNIPSLSTLKDKSWEFIYEHTPCDPMEPLLLRAAKLWYHWNLHAQNIAHWRYRIEQLEDVFPEFCERARVYPDGAVLKRLGVNINSRTFEGLLGMCWGRDRGGREPPAFIRNRFVNRAVYQHALPFDWSALRVLDRDVFEQVMSLANTYGYTAADLCYHCI
jgi:hypothetical protein